MEPPPRPTPADPLDAVRAGASPGEAIASLAARGETRRVVVDGIGVAWHRFGQGAPLVLLHGGHGSWLHGVRNVDCWSAARTVWVPDMPGYGESDAPAAPTLDALLQALQGSLDALVGRDTTIDLVGFSFGGLVAAHLAVRRGRVGHRVLLGPAGHGSVRRPRGELRSWRAAQAAGDAAALTDLLRHNLATHMLAEGREPDPLALHIHTEACLKTRFHSRTISRGGGLAQALDGVDGPVTLIWGEHDVTATPTALAETLVRGRPQRQAVIVPDAGHWVAYEAAPAVNDAVLGCLASREH